MIKGHIYPSSVTRKTAMTAENSTRPQIPLCDIQINIPGTADYV